MAKLTFVERTVAEFVWGGVPTDVDWVRNSNLFNNKFEDFTGIKYVKGIDLEDFVIRKAIVRIDEWHYKEKKCISTPNLVTVSWKALLKWVKGWF